MWTPEEMDAICQALRAESRVADEALVEGIAREVDDYRDWYAKHRASQAVADAVAPPDDLRERLWLIGWMIYEASWQALRWARPADGGGELDNTAARFVRRLAEVARLLPWPHFAPRALGAIRADALLASKRDTPQGYNEAFLLHREARERHDDYVANHGSAAGRELELLGLKEIYLQLVLAETGTACRTAERVVGRWVDEIARDAADRQWDEDDEDHWVQIMFQQLSLGVTIGEQALDTAAEIEREHEFADGVDRRRLAVRTAYRNPGIMTARAALHLLPLTYEMAELGLRPGSDYESWDELRAATVRRLVKAYQAIEKPVVDRNGAPVPLVADHRRSVVQLRLNAALVLPGLALPSTLDFADCLVRDPLDDGAAEELSAWLAATDAAGRRNGNANAIGSATLPAFVRGVDACRAARGVPGGYREWRRRWFALDRYIDEDEPGRRTRVHQTLTP
ncbi:hypothetical protein WEI85_14010 [Actinomycetes bacterium KLBMP 9797]